jgi:hypothetical protein
VKVLPLPGSQRGSVVLEGEKEVSEVTEKVRKALPTTLCTAFMMPQVSQGWLCVNPLM